MAEALVNHTLAGQWQAFSAGTVPVGYVHPKAIEALALIGIDHQGESKLVNTFRNETFDLVVTVCDDAAENCPVWLGKGKKVHIGFPDPAKVVGTEAEILAAFVQVRDDIQRQIIPYLQNEG